MLGGLGSNIYQSKPLESQENKIIPDKRELFDFMIDRVKYTQRETGKAESQAFGLWFLGMYFQNPQNIFVSDGSQDGKVDVFFTTDDGHTVTHHIINTKYTREYNKQAPAHSTRKLLRFGKSSKTRPDAKAFLKHQSNMNCAPTIESYLMPMIAMKQSSCL